MANSFVFRKVRKLLALRIPKILTIQKLKQSSKSFTAKALRSEPERVRVRSMLGLLKRHEVEILLRAGHRKTEVARLTGVSLCSVKRIAEESPIVHVDDAAERTKRQIGRPSTIKTFRKHVMEILEETPDLVSLEILRRVREAGYRGGKTALYDLVASLRPKPAKPLR